MIILWWPNNNQATSIADSQKSLILMDREFTIKANPVNLGSCWAVFFVTIAKHGNIILGNDNWDICF